jgi:prepilin-type N-terminal cleavage/methylation domain-containing protein
MIHSRRMKQKCHGFTLIELLIVIAIILILIAIALPNFLEAQIRSRIARVKSEFKGIEVALESYRTDYKRYPTPEDYRVVPGPYQDKYRRNFRFPVGTRITDAVELTTPVKYLTSLAYPDLFVESGQHVDDLGAGTITTYYYLCYETFGLVRYGVPPSFDAWALASWGPDVDDSGVTHFPYFEKRDRLFDHANWGFAFYSPTNGTYSTGDLVRLGQSAGTPGCQQYAK